MGCGCSPFHDKQLSIPGLQPGLQQPFGRVKTALLESARFHKEQGALYI
jgi:hypothetical protein